MVDDTVSQSASGYLAGEGIWVDLGTYDRIEQEETMPDRSIGPSDAEWQLIEPLLPELKTRRGRPRKHSSTGRS